MANSVATITKYKDSKPNDAVTVTHLFDSTGQTDWVKISGSLAVQFSGAGTSITYKVERSTVDPAGTANTVLMAASATVNPSTGVVPLFYTEPGVAWYRVNVTAITGVVLISINGGNID